MNKEDAHIIVAMANHSMNVGEVARQRPIIWTR